MKLVKINATKTIQPLYLKTPMRDHNERKIQIQWKNIGDSKRAYSYLCTMRPLFFFFFWFSVIIFLSSQF